jgi:formylglycine-generating enzyme required for sulfatase activity
MTRIYISSTYEDLKKERESAAQAIRRLGHQTIAMEDYVASDIPPVDKCLKDVCKCDVYIGIFAWRYGFIPHGHNKSITHLEYEIAKEAGIPRLIFLLDKKSQWCLEYVDTGDEYLKIEQLREKLNEENTVSFFRNADELSGLLSAAVSNLILKMEWTDHKFKKPEDLIGKRLGKNVPQDKVGREKRFRNTKEVLEAFSALSKEPQKTVKGKFLAPLDHEQQPCSNKNEDFESSVINKARKVYKNEKGFVEADFGDDIIMIYIPAGDFTMGENDDAHMVYLDDYWIGKIEVTRNQFQLFVESSKYKTDAEKSKGAYTKISYKWKQKRGINWKNPGFIQDDGHPVVCISWNDAVEYCKWLSGEKGLTFTLPSEAQWEKAARGADRRKYPWGNHDPYYLEEFYANYDPGIYNWDLYEKKRFYNTSPVEFYPKGESPYGLSDMAGNVWEWCSDWHESSYYNISSPKNPKGPPYGVKRVVRGGSWHDCDMCLCCANRDSFAPSFRGSNLGFRLLLNIK